MHYLHYFILFSFFSFFSSTYFRLAEGANCLKYLEYPENSIEIIQDDELNLDPEEGQEFVQITPQKIKLKLRPGIDFEFSFEVAQSKDYPVDLYYLMDLSNSMSDDKETIVRMGNLILPVFEIFTTWFHKLPISRIPNFPNFINQSDCFDKCLMTLVSHLVIG